MIERPCLKEEEGDHRKGEENHVGILGSSLTIDG